MANSERNWRFWRRPQATEHGVVVDRGIELRAAVIGLGKLGILHAATLNALPGSRLVAITDSTKPVLSAIEGSMPLLRTFTDYEEMLAECKPDVVAIATPTGSHCEIASRCIEAGIATFIEKPLAARVEQVRPVIDALARHPVANMVGYMTRFMPTFRKAKGVIASGALGNGQMLRSNMYIWQLFKAGKGWRYSKRESGGGVLITQNSHLLDLLLWYFGDIDSVSARTRNLYSADVEDYAHVVMTFRSGLLGYLDASWSARHHRTPTISISYQAENGTLDVDDDEVRLYLEEPAGEYASGWTIWKKPDLPTTAIIDIGGSHYTDQMQEFLAAARGQGQVSSDVASAIKVQYVLDAAYKSALNRGTPMTIGAMS
jgi:predicted dehydrogenase